MPIGAARTWLLAGAAALGVGLLVADRQRSSIPGSARRATEASVTSAPVRVPLRPPALAGAPAWRAHYALLSSAPTFVTSDFRPRPAPAAPVRGREPDPAPAPVAAGPADLQLRLTGFVGHGAARQGVLEERALGRGAVVGAGARLGEATVAAVQTDALLLDRAGGRETVRLGEFLALPRRFEGDLERLGPASAPAAPADPAPGGASPELSPEKLEDVLARLRERRRASLEGQAAAAAPPPMPTAPGRDPAEPLDDVLERLRRRRQQQQTGGGAR